MGLSTRAVQLDSLGWMSFTFSETANGKKLPLKDKKARLAVQAGFFNSESPNSCGNCRRCCLNPQPTTGRNQE